MSKPKSMLEIMMENIQIGKSGFSGEHQIFGIFKAVREIEDEGYIHKSEVRKNNGKL